MPIEEYLREQRRKPTSGQSFRTTARGLRELFRRMQFIDDSEADIYVTGLGREAARFAHQPMDQRQKAFWRRVIRNIVHDGDGAESHPYQVLLRLVARVPGITRAKCALALEASDDSPEELDRIVALAALPEEEIRRRIHVTKSNWDNAKKVLPKFGKEGETVLDPFVGVGSTLKAAALERRAGIGIELNKKYARLAEQRLATELDPVVLHKHPQRIIRGDARKAIRKLPKDSVKLVVTSPPYWNILHKKDHKAKQERVAKKLDTQYSDDPADLGNIADYKGFVSELADTLALTRACLSDGGHLCLVVGDFRHKSKYVMFHADIATAMEDRGFKLHGVKILYQRHKRVFPYGFPYAYVPNLHHQYIVILAK